MFSMIKRSKFKKILKIKTKLNSKPLNTIFFLKNPDLETQGSMCTKTKKIVDFFLDFG